MRENEVRKMATLTSRGRLTIPKEIRQYLNLQPGQRVAIQIVPDGRVNLRPLGRDVRELKGILRSRRRRPVSVEAMNEACAQGFAGR
jgi:AbrB family looped-hinge helix DNA binding protein